VVMRPINKLCHSFYGNICSVAALSQDHASGISQQGVNWEGIAVREGLP